MRHRSGCRRRTKSIDLIWFEVVGHDTRGTKNKEPDIGTYRVAQKTGPSYLIANILKTPRPNCVEIGELRSAEHSH